MNRIITKIRRPKPRRDDWPDERHLHVTYEARTDINRPTVIVPFIRLRGRWLALAGFRPGDRIKVEVDYGRLTITRE